MPPDRAGNRDREFAFHAPPKHGMRFQEHERQVAACELRPQEMGDCGPPRVMRGPERRPDADELTPAEQPRKQGITARVHTATDANDLPRVAFPSAGHKLPIRPEPRSIPLDHGSESIGERLEGPESVQFSCGLDFDVELSSDGIDASALRGSVGREE